VRRFEEANQRDGITCQMKRRLNSDDQAHHFVACEVCELLHRPVLQIHMLVQKEICSLRRDSKRRYLTHGAILTDPFLSAIERRALQILNPTSSDGQALSLHP